MLLLEVVDVANSPIIFKVPLVDFAIAHDGPAQILKVFEEKSGLLEKELRAQHESKELARDDRTTRCK